MASFPHPRIIYLMFFASGAASLVCEVAWFKQLGIVFGSNTVTASIVIACFFAGLATGSLIAGRASDRWSRPLRVYGTLELALALGSLSTSLVLWQWSSWIGWFRPVLGVDSATALPVKGLLAMLVMLPATSLMGATLPVLTRYLVASRSQLAEQVGLLYGLNTFGAVAGSAVMGMWMAGALGVIESACLASLVYAAIGATALWLARDESAVESEVHAEAEVEVSTDERREAAWLAVVFGLGGFLAVGYEVLWFRVIRFNTAHTVYTFSTMLSTYLLGLVFGAFLCVRWVSRDKEHLLPNFARVQLGIALACTLSLGFAGQGRTVLELLGYSPLAPTGLLSLAVMVMLVLLVPTTLIGMSFPLASELSVVRLSRVGSRVGLLYSLNTYAGVLGSLTAGLVLLPLLGSQWSFLLLIAGNLALFILLWATQPRLRSAQLRRDGISATIGVVAIAAYFGPNYLIDQLTWGYPGEKLVIEETDDATFMVLQYDDKVAGRFQQFVVNGTSYASNRPEGRRYMGLLAHLPLLLHEAPKETVVICVGTGTTIGAASIHDRSEVVWSVDVTRHIYKYADHFAPKNQAFHRNPKVRQVAADGRDFLQTTDATFDVLTFEPPPPIESGVVNLYSLEFYRTADERLRDGGMVVQWIPFHQGFEEVHRMLIQTMAEVYPHVSLWVPDRHEGILIGSHKPLRIDPARVAAAMAEPDVAESLKDIGVYGVEDLLAMFVSADDDLRAFVGDADLVTDGHPRVEYFFGYENRPFHMSDVLAHATPLDYLLVGAPHDPEALARSREVVRLLWEATEGEYGKDLQRSVTALERAATLAPDNTYVAYRLALLRNRLSAR